MFTLLGSKDLSEMLFNVVPEKPYGSSNFWPPYATEMARVNSLSTTLL
jgi:hypothetical protein